jgi:hypothetical protein
VGAVEVVEVLPLLERVVEQLRVADTHQAPVSVIAAFATPMPVGTGTSPESRLVATVTTRQVASGSGASMDWRIDHGQGTD